jgi:hypothetical protein
MFSFRRKDRTDDISGRMQRAREEAYLRGAHEGKMFMLATGRS